MEVFHSIVNLKCLNCGANLQISEEVSEFACQYCGAFQGVLRKGGIVTLELISDKIDRIHNTANKTFAELKIQRLNFELKEIDELYEKLEHSLNEMKIKINPIAVTIIVLSILPFLLIAANTGSLIPMIFSGIVVILLIGIWRKIIDKLEADFTRSTVSLDKRALDIKDQIYNLKKLVASS